MTILKLHTWISVIFNELPNYGDFDYKKKMNLKESIVKAFITTENGLIVKLRKKSFSFRFVLFERHLVPSTEMMYLHTKILSHQPSNHRTYMNGLPFL